MERGEEWRERDEERWRYIMQREEEREREGKRETLRLQTCQTLA